MSTDWLHIPAPTATVEGARVRITSPAAVGHDDTDAALTLVEARRLYAALGEALEAHLDTSGHDVTVTQQGPAVVAEWEDGTFRRFTVRPTG